MPELVCHREPFEPGEHYDGGDGHHAHGHDAGDSYDDHDAEGHE